MLLKLSKFCLCTLVWVICTHCAKVQTFEPDNLPTTLFILGQIDPDIGADILVTRAVSTADTVFFRDLLVKNAEVTLIDGGGTRYNVPHLNDGKYGRDSSGLHLHAGAQYRIEVTAPGLPVAQSDWIVIPESTIPDTLGFTLDGGFNGDSPTGAGYIRFQPRGEANDCYLLRMQGIVDGFSPTRVSYQLEVAQLCDTYLRNGDACFNNTCFGANTPAEVLLKADAAYYFPITSEFKNYEKVILQFGAVSPQYHDYLFSLEQPEEWENGLVESKPGYSNITGAWGVFFASNTTRKVINL